MLNSSSTPYHMLMLTFNTIFDKLRAEESMTFPDRLRELRRTARMSQRALAERVGIDFTYLSKIENGRVGGPSEAVLRKIAEELATSLSLDQTELANELITLAGKIPSDLAETLSRNPEVLRILRSAKGNIRTAEDWRRLFPDQSEEGPQEKG